MAGADVRAEIRSFGLLGEAAEPAGPRFLHIEDLDVRSRLTDWKIDPHLHHDLHQVFLIHEGGGEVSVDGVLQTLIAPFLFLAPAGAVHAFLWAPEARGQVVTLSDGRLRLAGAGHDQILAAFRGPTWLSHAADWAPGLEAASALADLRRDLDAAGPGAEALVDGRLLVLLAAITRMLGAGCPVSPSAPSRDSALVSALRGLVERSFAEPVAMGDLAARLGVSEKQMRSTCRRAGALPPARMLIQRRMLEARRLLAYSALSVAEVGYAVGFSDPAYFTRAFTLEVGLSPRAYRADHK